MKRLLSIALALAIVCGLAIAVRTWLFTAVRIAGSSMENTLRSGDIALVTRLYGDAGHGDVVQCEFTGRSDSYVKRIVGLPGDTVEFSDGALILNGKPLSEPYVSSKTEDMSIELSADEYLALGDNRGQSYDSRAEDMGCIRRDQILGRVRWILWPLSRFGPVE